MEEEKINKAAEAAAEADAEETNGQEMPSPEQFLAMIFAGMETKQVLGVMFGILGEKAWENLGLKLAYGQKEEKMDLDSAKTAIDTLEFLSGQLKGTVSAEEQKFADNLIAQLQINYVTKKNQAAKD